ncbi:TIGR04222 domain-containing membrane protein [Streptomyces sp. NPDC018045]|uniref:TIGR04222 domain-containing membrane protein n=1 Tax=Streptomyces sp. NPDC018045 TaxID=3365037 RepID=UPI0037B68DB1
MTALLVTLMVAASSLLLVVHTVRVVRATPRPKYRRASAYELREIAFLTGGPARVADAAIAGMHQDGRIAVGGPGVVSVRQAVAYDPVETAVLDSLARIPDGALDTLRRHVMRAPAVQAVGDRLAKRGLMRHPRAGRPWRLFAVWQTGGCVVGTLLALLFTLNGALIDGGGGGGAPFVVRILPAALLGTVTGVVCRKVLAQRVTRAGTAAVRAFRTVHKADLVSDPAQSAALLVALGGTTLLVDDVLRDHLSEAQRSMAGASAGAYSGGSSAGTTTTASNASCGWNVPDGSADTSWCGSGAGSGCGSSSCGGSSGSGCGSGSSCGSSSGSSCGSSSSSSCGGGGCGSG